ncbi:hypothetical protein BKA62DRAFT_788557 [Auriculariales sp. MPI-PUGE-AT-0066]|nr:hypothetical protein BKA62DRAFT_788557 [Auriculariales sp. MPI-PUGE-AT-0066]
MAGSFDQHLTLTRTGRALGDALQVAWREALAEGENEVKYPDARFGPSTVREELLGSIYAELDPLVHEHNSAQPIDRLPLELLATVFSFVPEKQRTSISLVNRTWNKVLLSSPEIWSVVNYDAENYKSRDALATILRFSAESPLHLVVSINQWTHEELFSILRENIHRCITLSIRLAPDIPQDAAASFTAILCTASPMLKTFRLFDQPAIFNRGLIATGAFLGNSVALLTSVKLHCNIAALLAATTPLANVKQVMWSPVDKYLNNDISLLFQVFPSVGSLAVELDEWAVEDESVDFHEKFTPPASMKWLAIIANHRNANVPRFLKSVSWHQLPSVWISYNDRAISDLDGPVLSMLCHLPPPGLHAEVSSSSGQFIRPFVPRAVSFELPTKFSEHSLGISMFDVDIDLHIYVKESYLPDPKEYTEPTGERVMLDVDVRATFDPLVFAHVTRLYISEMAFDPDISKAPLPVFPSLHHLTIITFGEESHSNPRMLSPFIAASWRHSGQWTNSQHLICPVLQTLRIATQINYSLMRYSTLLTPDMVIGFLRAHLKYDGEQLQLIAFNGVSIFVDQEESFQKMLEMSVEMTWDARYISWGMKSHVMLNWG